MEYLISAVAILCFSLTVLWSYRRGLNDGIAISKDKAIKPIQTPIQAVKQHIESKKTDKKQVEEMQGFEAIMNYDPLAPKKKEGE